jgi:uncharacterized integral membrane protein
MYRLGFIILAIAAIAFGLIVGTLNSDPVKVDLLWIGIDWPLGLVMVITLVLGFGVGTLFTWLTAVLPIKLKVRKLREGSSTTVDRPYDDSDG